MLRIFVAIWIVMFGAADAHGQAFGVVGGAHVSRYQGVKSGVGYYRIKVPQPNSEFDFYTAKTTTTGLICKVTAFGRTYENDDYGTRVKGRFDTLSEALTTRYGPGRKFDFLRSGALWDEPREWVWSIWKNERELSYFWTPTTGADLPPGVQGIKLAAAAIDSSGAYLTLGYEFTNFSACKAGDMDGL